MRLAPISLRQARAFVEQHHRHNRAPRGWLFGTSLVDDEGIIHGVAIASRPVARSLDDGRTIEIIRVATDGTRNANSRLYGAVCRAAKALGYVKAYTYTLDSESGSSLRAVGFVEEARIAGTRDWVYAGQESMRAPMLFEDRYPQHEGEKIRWSKVL